MSAWKARGERFSSSAQPQGHSSPWDRSGASGSVSIAALPVLCALSVCCVNVPALGQLLPTGQSSLFSTSKHCWDQSKHSWCLPTAAPGPALPRRTAQGCSLTSALGTAFPGSSSSSSSSQLGFKAPLSALTLDQSSISFFFLEY